MSYKQKSPIPIAEGGTNSRASDINVPNGVMVYTGVRIIPINPNLSGKILTSNGPLLPPTFQDAPPSGVITINGDTGSATGDPITLAGGSNITTSATGSTVTFDLDNTVSVSGSVTAGTGLIATTGGITAQGISNINTSAADFATSIGNLTGASPLALKSGTGGINLETASTGDVIINSADTILVDTVNNIEINSSTGSIFIGNDDRDLPIDIGTDGERPITIGNNVGDTEVKLYSGALGFDIFTTGICAINASDLFIQTPTFGIFAITSTLDVNASSNITLDSSGGTIGMGTAAQNTAINIGTAGARAITIGNTTGATSVNINMGTGGLNIPSFDEGALITDATGKIATITGTAGYVLTANSAGTAPSFQAAPAGIMPWTAVSASTVSLAVGNGYIIDNGTTLVTATLPATAAVGDIIAIVGKSSGGWTIAQNSGQTIHFGAVNTTTGTGGSLSSTLQYDNLELICITANTNFAVRAPLGNITYV